MHPHLGLPIADLQRCKSVFLIGSHLVREQPLAALRVRKAVEQGAQVFSLQPMHYDTPFSQTCSWVVPSTDIAQSCAEVLALLLPRDEQPAWMQGRVPSQEAHRIVEGLRAKPAALLLGAVALHHPQAALIRTLARAIARAVGGTYGELPECANTVGAWIAGAVPHRGPWGEKCAVSGKNIKEILSAEPSLCFLYNIEPDADVASPQRVQKALKKAWVVAFTPYASESLLAVADVLLPIAPMTEMSGTFFNIEGTCQYAQAFVQPYQEARPGWKVLRVLANLCGLEGFDYQKVTEVSEALSATPAAVCNVDDALPSDVSFEKTTA